MAYTDDNQGCYTPAAMRFGEYELLKELGRGATARVHLARHVSTQKEVCLKIFHPRLFGDSRSASRIEREMEVSAQLQHPGIVRVHEVLKETDPPAIVMDYIAGENLESFQRRLPYVLPEVSVWIVVRILDALAFAHEAGVIHRDLKPENVLVAADGRIVVTDFGLAKLRDSSTLTQSNVILGSLDYLAPEQARGDVVGTRSDLFSVGAILYFLTTGTRPFSRQTPLATLAAIQNEEPEPPQRRNPKLSGALGRILQKALSKEPANRYADAAEFRAALVGYLESVGLVGSLFTLDEWMREPSAVTLDALKTSAETLTHACEKALSDQQQDKFLETLAHLSLKAPESPALARLTEGYRLTRARRARWRVGAAIILFLFILGTGIVGWRWSSPPSPQATARQAPPTEAPVPSEALVEASPEPPASAPVTTAETKKAAPAPAKRTGTVVFDLDPDVKVFWNGHRVDPTKPLKNARVGSNTLVLERPGFDPIGAKVKVKAGEPTIIRVKGNETSEGRR